MRGPRPGKPGWLQFLSAAGGILLLTALYVVLMWATVDATTVGDGTTASDRDNIHIALHLSLLVAAAGFGFALGKWLNGQGVAYGVLFVSALAALMLMLQLGSYELACEGHNDLIRHWECGEAG